MISLYVHIPFCASRCPYCDFATAPATTALRARYLDALVAEVSREGAALGRPEVGTVFFGGGTPSLLEPDEVARLGAALHAAFDLRPVEVTVEANPATLDRARLDAWLQAGATRLSLGAQTFSERGLRALGRTHQPSDVAPAVAAARDAGLAVSLDLIFGWPDQTTEEWRADIRAAIALRVDHVSCYPLELVLEPEEAVANWPGGGWPTVRRWRERASGAQTDDAGLARMYRTAERALRAAGFGHYEIANWARPGAECRHNLVYWRNGEWLGLGAGAHSHLSGARSRRPASLARYIADVGAGTPRVADEAADDAVDVPMLALRLADGLDLREYADRFGAAHAERVRVALADGAIASLVRTRDDRVRLTERGRLLASEVFVRIITEHSSTPAD